MKFGKPLQSEKKLVDVTGIEPVTPACKARESTPTPLSMYI